MACAFFFASLPNVANAQTIFPPGDVNGDGVVDIADAMLIRRVVQGTRPVESSVFAAGFMNGDVNYDGAVNATDAKLIAQYVVGMSPLPEAPAQTRKVLYYHTDHLGGSNIITDGQGNIVQQVQYTPYGKISYELNLGVSVNYLYTGQQLDRETGLYYYNARYYDPDIGRFIQPDTIIPDPTDSQAYNRYAYCRNNPVMMNDPSGHFGVSFGGVTISDDGVEVDPWEMITRKDVASGGEALDTFDDNAELNRDEVNDITPNEIKPYAGTIVAIVVTCYAGPVAGAVAGAYVNAYFAGEDRDGRYKAMAIAAVCAYVGSDGGWVSGATSGAMSGGINAAQYGGNMGDAMWKGAAIGAVSGAMGDYYRGNTYGIIASGMVSGGLSGALNDGNIAKGMLQGAAMAAATVIAISMINSWKAEPKNHKAKVFIEEPDSSSNKLGRKGMSGHSGIAIDDEFYDFGPQPHEGENLMGSEARPWWDKMVSDGNANLQEISEFINDNGIKVTVLSMDITESQATKLTQYWDDVYSYSGTYHFAGKQCTTMVGGSLRDAGVSSVRAWKPVSLENGLRREGWK